MLVSIIIFCLILFGLFQSWQIIKHLTKKDVSDILLLLLKFGVMSVAALLIVVIFIQLF